MAEIKVFLKSTLLSGQITSLHYSYDYHYYMEKHFRENYHWLRSQGFSKGRIFEPDSAALLPVLSQAMEAWGAVIRVYDLNTMKGKLCGWLFGVRKTPGVLVNGKKHIGREAAYKALKEIAQSPNDFISP